MKKYLQLLAAIVLMLAILGVARYSSAWASSQRPSPIAAGAHSPLETAITITGSGTYNIGGVCTLAVTYNTSGLQDRADAEVPLSQSGQVPFNNSLETLIQPGCHIVHVKNGATVSQMNDTDGTWNVCFGINSNLKKVDMYYYLDTPESGGPVWTLLPSTVKNGYICASAPFTGVYMPAGETTSQSGPATFTSTGTFPGGCSGTVCAPPSQVRVTNSGTYEVGGICALLVNYYMSGLSDQLTVQFPTQDTKTVPFFPSNKGTLYLPGCHVEHYLNSNVLPTTTSSQGTWMICFSTHPGVTTTIYYYRDDLATIAPPWTALDTTTHNGMACAPLANFSAVYAPAGN
ncbi:MAG TPA: hypothetical protein VLZ89_08455 [Anaerolineales bacterium]|nr:hypothetical protein [Anaerolineales bacterium]